MPPTTMTSWQDLPRDCKLLVFERLNADVEQEARHFTYDQVRRSVHPETATGLLASIRHRERGSLRFTNKENLALYYASLPSLVVSFRGAPPNLSSDEYEALAKRALMRAQVADNVRRLEACEGVDWHPEREEATSKAITASLAARRFASLSRLSVDPTHESQMDLLATARRNGHLPRLHTLELRFMTPLDLAPLAHFAGIQALELWTCLSRAECHRITGGSRWLLALRAHGLRSLKIEDMLLQRLTANNDRDPSLDAFLDCSRDVFEVAVQDVRDDPPRFSFEGVERSAHVLLVNGTGTGEAEAKAPLSCEKVGRMFPNAPEVHVYGEKMRGKGSHEATYVRHLHRAHTHARIMPHLCMRDVCFYDTRELRDLRHACPCLSAECARAARAGGCCASGLRSLALVRCPTVTSLEGLAGMGRLQELVLDFSHPDVQRKIDMAPLGRLTSLRSLIMKIKRCGPVSDLESITAELGEEPLRDDDPTWFPNLSDALGRLTNLTSLKLYHAPAGPLAAALPRLGRQLTCLSFKTSSEIGDADLKELSSGLCHATQLRALHVISSTGAHFPPAPVGVHVDAGELFPLDFLRNMPHLRVLRCKGVRIPTLRPLACCPSAPLRLRVLSLICSTTEEEKEDDDGGHLRHLSPLKNLEALDLDFFNLTDLSPLSGLTSLRCLDANYIRSDATRCHGVQELSRLTSLTALHLTSAPCEEHELERIREALLPCRMVSCFMTNC